MRCVEKKPKDRYQATQDLLDDLIQLKGSEEESHKPGQTNDTLDHLLGQAIMINDGIGGARVLEQLIAFISLRKTHDDVVMLQDMYQKLTDPNLLNLLIEHNLDSNNYQLLYQFFSELDSSGAVPKILQWFKKEKSVERKEFLGELAVTSAGRDLAPLIAYGLELSDAEARILLKAFGQVATDHKDPIFLKWALHSGYRTQMELIKIINTTNRNDFEVFGVLEYFSSGKGTIHREVKQLASDLLAEKQIF